MTSVCRTLNPIELPTVTSTDPMSHKYSIETYLKKAGTSNKSISSGSALQDTVELKRDELFTKLTDEMTEIIRFHTGDTYTPPTGLPTITTSTTLQDFIDHYLNVTVNVSTSTGYPFDSSAPAKARAEFIITKFFLLFVRVQQHILTSESSEVICSDDSPRLFYMEIENCLFKTIFTYN